MESASFSAYLVAFAARLSWGEIIGYAGVVLSVATSSVRTMVPLRSLGIATNLAFLAYGLVSGMAAAVIVSAILLPVNAGRLVEMLRLVRQARTASRSDLSMDWLKPFMHPRTLHEGEVLIRKGDRADCLYYLLEGRCRLRESGIEIGPGELVGEIGLLTPERCRTQTVECIEAGAVLTVSYDEITQIYHQNPGFGFYFLKLTSSRLLENIAALEGEVGRLRAAAVRTIVA